MSIIVLWVFCKFMSNIISDSPRSRLISSSRDLTKLILLEIMLNQPITFIAIWKIKLSYFLSARTATSDSLVGWGLRPSTVRARVFAERHSLPFIALEDGFLRSYNAG